MVSGNVKVGGRIAIAFALVIGAVAVTSGNTLSRLSVLGTVSAVNSQGSDVVNHLDDALEAALQTRVEFDQVALNSGKAFEGVGTKKKLFEEAIGAAQRRNANYPKEREVSALIGAFAMAFDAWYAAAGEALAQPDQDQDQDFRSNAAQVLTSERMVRLEASFVSAAETAKSRVALWSAGDQSAEDDMIAMTRMLQGVGLLAAMGAAMMIGSWLWRSIARPIVAMTSTMSALADGDNAIAVPGVGRRDEIGAMAAAVQTFKDLAIEKARLDGEASAKTAEEQSRAIEHLGEGLKQLAGGDLTNYLTEDFTDAYTPIKDDFNSAVVKLRDTMLAVISGIDAIRSGTYEHSSATKDLAQRTERQAATLAQAADAIEEVTNAVRLTSVGAHRACEVVDAARLATERSDAIMRQATHAMNAIEVSSKKIVQVTGVIDDIALQTNLLAINAGVEAAHARGGSSGFAIIASEVRALALRSGKAAQEIKGLISISTSRISEGVALVVEVSETLRQILEQITEVACIVTGISASADEQSTTLSAINTAVGEIDQVTQKNASMVDASVVASRQLADETKELAQLIGRFKTGSEATVHRAARASFG